MGSLYICIFVSLYIFIFVSLYLCIFASSSKSRVTSIRANVVCWYLTQWYLKKLGSSYLGILVSSCSRQRWYLRELGSPYLGVFVSWYLRIFVSSYLCILMPQNNAHGRGAI